MYRDIIKIREDVPEGTVSELRRLCIDAHNNRAGQVDLQEISKRHFVFEAEEEMYGCLQLGYLALDRSTLFRRNVKSWTWEDEEPDENCNLLEVLSRVVV